MQGAPAAGARAAAGFRFKSYRYTKAAAIMRMAGLAAVKVELDVEGLPAPPLPGDARGRARAPAEMKAEVKSEQQQVKVEVKTEVKPERKPPGERLALQKRLSNASVTLQKHFTSGPHVHLGVFIHCGGFHGQ